MELRLAQSDDLALLTQLRLDFLREDFGLNDRQTDALRVQLPDYYARHLNRDFFALLGEEGGQTVCTAFWTVNELPGNPNFLNGRTGTVLNVYTLPQARRRGLATQLLGRLLALASEQQLAYLELKATAMGEPLYRKLGFTVHASSYPVMRHPLTK